MQRVGIDYQQAVAALSYYTPENNPSLYHEAETWLALVLSDVGWL